MTEVEQHNEDRRLEVSVVMCTYNGEAYVAAQLDTLLAQTYPLNEIIIQDDGSDDGTWDIINGYAEKHPHIKVFRNEAGRGVNSNFLSAMRRAKSDYIAICDQDDLWEPTKIERQITAIEHHLHAAEGSESANHPPIFTLCSHKTKPFSDDGSSVHYDPRRPNTGLLRLVYSSEMPGHTMLFHRRLLDFMSPDDGIFAHRCYDVILQLAAGAAESVVFINEPLTHFRRHQTAATLTEMSTSTHSWRNAVRQLWFCLRHYKAIKRASHDSYASMRSYLEALPFRTKSRREALKMLNMELSHGPLNFLRFQCFCFKHRHEIFFTPGKGFVNGLRALMYPLLSVHYKRHLLRMRPK